MVHPPVRKDNLLAKARGLSLYKRMNYVLLFQKRTSIAAKPVFGRLRIPRSVLSYTYLKILVPRASEMEIIEFANSIDSDEAARNERVWSFAFLVNYVTILTLKAPNKNYSRRHFNFLLLSFEENKA